MNWDAAVVKCVVCDRRKQYGRKIQYFRFPHDSGKCRSWVKAIGKEELLSLTLDELHEKYVCESHFPPECINQNANRLHKVALPTLTTQSLPLDDDLLSDFLLTKDKTELDPMIKNASIGSLPKAIVSANASKSKCHDPEPVINYDRPLMTCLETLVHNQSHHVKKPAGLLNSISVPLLAYSSSLEKGTVFAATALQNLPEVSNFRPVTTTEINQFNSIGFNRKNLATYAKNVSVTQNDDGSRFKAIKNYKRVKTQPYTSVRKNDVAPSALVNEYPQKEHTEESNKEANKETTPIETLDITDENEEGLPATYTNTDITLVPYPEHEVNLAPEAFDAHVGGGMLDSYGLPLMNCLGFLLKQNISTPTISTEDPNTTIDMPLMKCFKVLEDIDL